MVIDLWPLIETLRRSRVLYEADARFCKINGKYQQSEMACLCDSLTSLSDLFDTRAVTFNLLLFLLYFNLTTVTILCRTSGGASKQSKPVEFVTRDEGSSSRPMSPMEQIRVIQTIEFEKSRDMEEPTESDLEVNFGLNSGFRFASEKISGFFSCSLQGTNAQRDEPRV